MRGHRFHASTSGDSKLNASRLALTHKTPGDLVTQ
jgi:hypothetical protein